MIRHTSFTAGIVGFLLVAIVILGVLAAWGTHVYACISAGAYLLLAIGCFFFPVGIIHGIMVWCGAAWVPF